MNVKETEVETYSNYNNNIDARTLMGEERIITINLKVRRWQIVGYLVVSSGCRTYLVFVDRFGVDSLVGIYLRH